MINTIVSRVNHNDYPAIIPHYGKLVAVPWWSCDLFYSMRRYGRATELRLATMLEF